jgi:RNA polymerase sigma factor (sigma-70 family)
MASGFSGDAVRQINRLFRDGTAAGLTDGQLIERFTTRRPEVAEIAFETLVNRHGPMVLRVVKGILRDPHDVEDAFQATFLVLVKKAHTIGEREQLSAWLYGVAHRVALKARGVAARRNRREGGVIDDPPADPAEGPWLDLRPILHEELNRLPDKYKKPVILCHLQGLTHAEAAQELAWPVGTVSVRLTRARKLLKDRLTRRGLTVTATLWAVGLGAEGVSAAAVSPTLIQSTTKAALAASMGKLVAAGTMSAGAITLTKRTLTMMLMSRLKWIVAPLAFGVGAAGGVVVNQQIQIRSAEAQAKAAEAQAKKALAAAEEVKPPAEPEIKPQANTARPARLTLPPIPPSPFGMDDLPPEPSNQPPAEPEPPPKIEPPLAVRDGEVVLDPPPGYFDLPAPHKNDGTDPPIIKVGQVLQVEVLEALPGRPINGDRVVRPDGTISLGFYGDLRVAGLNRHQAKLKLIEHMREFLKDEPLGLVSEDWQGNYKVIPPVQSSRVFIDESLNYAPASREKIGAPQVRSSSISLEDQIKSGRIDVLEGYLHRIVKDLNEVRDEIKSPKPQKRLVDDGILAPEVLKEIVENGRREDLTVRLGGLEGRLYRVLKALEDLKDQVRPLEKGVAPPADPAAKPPG